MADAADDALVEYAMHYGSGCKDCADAVDGMCLNRDGMPCNPFVKRAVARHTIKALEYGITHGFIVSPPWIATDQSARIAELEAALAEAMAALEPFAAAGYGIEADDEDRWEIWERPEAMNITVGHLRRARDVYSKRGGA